MPNCTGAKAAAISPGRVLAASNSLSTERVCLILTWLPQVLTTAGIDDDKVVTECPGGSFCYGNQNFDCCNANQGVYVVNGEQMPHNFNATSTSSSSTSTTSQSATSTSNAPAMTTTATSPGILGSGLSSGAKIGIGVGVALGGLLVLLLLVWYVMSRRRRNAQSYNSERTRVTPLEKGSDADRVPPLEKDAVDSVHRVEMPPHQPTEHFAELGNTERRL